ncbi:hypothetical protein J6590_098511 [Homalodisca vitripennis]|nr:hypothetical protein J6590_098511 [Homalodisca vitripennis]
MGHCVQEDEQPNPSIPCSVKEGSLNTPTHLVREYRQSPYSPCHLQVHLEHQSERCPMSSTTSDLVTNSTILQLELVEETTTKVCPSRDESNSRSNTCFHISNATQHCALSARLLLHANVCVVEMK